MDKNTFASKFGCLDEATQRRSAIGAWPAALGQRSNCLCASSSVDRRNSSQFVLNGMQRPSHWYVRFCADGIASSMDVPARAMLRTELERLAPRHEHDAIRL